MVNYPSIKLYNEKLYLFQMHFFLPSYNFVIKRKSVVKVKRNEIIIVKNKHAPF